MHSGYCIDRSVSYALDREQLVMPKIEDHHIAAAQLAINRQVEHGQVAAPPLDHQPSSNHPDVLWP